VEVASFWNAACRLALSDYVATTMELPMLKYALVAAGALVVASPAYAEWFIVRGPDKQCRVVETRPTDKKIVIIGDKAYVTRDEAERQVKIVCREQ
jgi:hypothetical protein